MPAQARMSTSHGVQDCSAGSARSTAQRACWQGKVEVRRGKARAVAVRSSVRVPTVSRTLSWVTCNNNN